MRNHRERRQRHLARAGLRDISGNIFTKIATTAVVSFDAQA